VRRRGPLAARRRSHGNSAPHPDGRESRYCGPNFQRCFPSSGVGLHQPVVIGIECSQYALAFTATHRDLPHFTRPLRIAMQCNGDPTRSSRLTAHPSRRSKMPKLLFDPVAYQFFYRCRPEDSTPAIAAGFGWDPIRRRYYTEDPMVAIVLASRGDDYVKQLLADALETAVPRKRPEAAGRRQKSAPAVVPISMLSNSVH
jgi:hypothetical protein